MPTPRTVTFAFLIAGLAGVAVYAVGQESPAKKASAAPGGGKQAKPIIRAAAEGDAESAIRGSADRFADAYNRHDAKAVAACFTTGAEFVTETGTTLRGRESLERHFAHVFADSPKVRLELKVESVRKLASGAALEEGTVTLVRAPDERPVVSRYTALHVAEEGGWRVALVRDTAARGSADLADLDWLVGDWMDESEGALILTSCRRSDSGDHLEQNLTIRRPGEPATTGTTRIAWDPQTGQIKSWTFDARGGRSESLWVRAPTQDTWILKSQGVTAAGRSFSATAVLRKIDADTLTWESRDRVEGGVVLPDMGPVTVKRRPPAPGE